MSLSTTPREVATAFVKAFASRRMEDAAEWVADEVAFTSPRVQIRGRDAYLAAVGEFSGVVTGLDLLETFGDESRAMLVYDMHTVPFGVIRAADLYVVRDGLIVRNDLLFDTAAMRPTGSVEGS